MGEPKPLRIRVCAGCAWTDREVRRTLRGARERYGDRVRIVKRDCFDRCDRGPVVRVGKKTLAPAKRKAVRRRIEKELEARGT